MLLAHFYILAVWLLLWVVFYGWGTLVGRVARCERLDVTALLVNPWIGLAAVIGVLQIWHFFARVNTVACGTVCVVGVLSAAVWGFGRLPSVVAAVRRGPIPAALIGLLVLWLVNRSLHPPFHTDHGLYYLNTIRWTADYAIAPGLANLHTRLAFNNSSFLLHALVEVLIGRGWSAHVVNGLLAAMTVPIAAYGFSAVFRKDAEERQVGWYHFALAMMVALSASDGRIYSATPDLPATLLISLAVWRLLVVCVDESESTGVRLRWNLLAISLLATAAVVVKVFVVFFAALAGIALAAILYRIHRAHNNRPLLDTVRSLGFAAVCALLLFVPWVGRGYVFSGYPMFPSTFAGAPVDWKYDADSAANLREIYRIWFRAYDPTKYEAELYRDGWAWVPEWLVQVVLLRSPLDMALPTGIAVASMFWLGWYALIHRRDNDSGRKSATPFATTSLVQFCGWLLAAAYCAAIVPWFLTAPGPRFATFFTWGLAGICLGLAGRTVPPEWTARHRWFVLGISAAMLLLPMLDQAVRIETRYRYNTKHFFYERPFYQSYPFVLPTGEGGFPPVPQTELVEHTTDSGLTVYLAAPKPGDEAHELVWDSPLPASQHYFPKLELRRPGDLQGGFRMASPAATNGADNE